MALKEENVPEKSRVISLDLAQQCLGKVCCIKWRDSESVTSFSIAFGLLSRMQVIQDCFSVWLEWSNNSPPLEIASSCILYLYSLSPDDIRSQFGGDFFARTS